MNKLEQLKHRKILWECPLFAYTTMKRADYYVAQLHDFNGEIGRDLTQSYEKYPYTM